MLVKICGLSTPPTLDAALEAGADLVGFVFFPPSPRHVALEQGGLLARRAAGRARTVVLTVDADDGTLDAVVRHFAPDLLQLHGRETPDRLREVRARFERPVIKAIGLQSAEDLARAAAYDESADYLMFDAKAPRAATRPGGNGAPFDWDMLRAYRGRRPWLLAGGLTPETVATAIAATQAPAVDVSSGVETSPGVKDVAKIRAFLQAARAATRVGTAAARE